MKKNKTNDSHILLANIKRQPLKEHSLAVAFYGHLLLKSLKFKPSVEKEMNRCLMLSALLHDIGKISKSFQNYITKTKEKDLEDMPTDAEALRKSFSGPFHNEISWAYIADFITIEIPLIRKIISHSVYWHHPANWNDKNNKMYFENSEKIFNNIEGNLKENIDQLLKNMYNFTSNLLGSFYNYYGDNFNFLKLKNPDKNQIQGIQYPYFFEHNIDTVEDNAKKQLCLNLLLEADRAVSSWTPNKLKDFLYKIKESDKKISSWDFFESKNFLEQWSKASKIDNREAFSVSENINEDQRSQEQYNLAKKMLNKKLSVCGVDPAGGKTSIALYWWNGSNNNYPLMISLPRQHQVTGLFQSLQQDSKRVFGSANIKVEGVFNGRRQISNWDPLENGDLMTSDINIMVFDRFLSPYYKRSQSSEFIKMLSSHLVLDEFHEFKNIPKMIPSLKEVLTIRSWLDSGVKTLMLSGTPEPALLKLLNVEKHDIFKREELSPRKNHKFKILEDKKMKEEQIFFRDCLYSFLRVESCQKFFASLYKKYQDKIQLIHSYFTSKDKKSKLEGILREHSSPDLFLSEKAVVTAKMLQSSYNLSFRKAILEISQPDTDCQTAGRINRFGNKTQAEMHFFYNEETENFFNENRAGFKKIHQAWKEHLLNFIKKNKEHDVSIRELMKSYDCFWSNNDNIKKAECIFKKQQENAIKDLNKYIPKRFIAKKSKKSFSALNNLFRGESRFLSACVVDDKGQSIDQLTDENLLNEGRTWLIKQIIDTMKFCLKTKDSCKKANTIKEENVFEYNKHIIKHAHKSLGYKMERPLLLSHYDSEVDKCLAKWFYDQDKNTTEHRVYNKIYGLVKKSLLKDDE